MRQPRDRNLRRAVLGLFSIAISAVVAADDNAPTSKIVSYKGIQVQTYWTDANQLRAFWKDPKTNKPYKRFSKIQQAVQQSGNRIGAIMNGGIFEPGRIPTGLHVEKGKILNPINRRDGDGNFYLKPNGIFFIDNNQVPSILDTTEFPPNRKIPRLAIQSGPLLLRNNVIHPKFSKTSKHRRDRNGIGITKTGKVLFACTIAEQTTFITLYEFAEFFRSQGCTDALFLDGDLSELIIEPKGPVHVRNEYAAILVALKPTKHNRKQESD